jgi:hypothetical protein
MEKTELQIEWERRIAVFRTSGQTQSKWCQVNNLSLHQLRYWLKKIELTTKSGAEPATKWIPVSMEEIPLEPNETLQIKVGQASIEVKPGFNPSLLADVVRTLKALC